MSLASHGPVWHKVLEAQAVSVTEKVELVSCFVSSVVLGARCFP